MLLIGPAALSVLRQCPRQPADDRVDLSLRQRGEAEQQTLAPGGTDPMDRKRWSSDFHGRRTAACFAVVHSSAETIVQITDEVLATRISADVEQTGKVLSRCRQQTFLLDPVPPPLAAQMGREVPLRDKRCQGRLHEHRRLLIQALLSSKEGFDER